MSPDSTNSGTIVPASKPDAHDIVGAVRIALLHAPADAQQALAVEQSPGGQAFKTFVRGVLASRGFSPEILGDMGTVIMAALRLVSLLGVPAVVALSMALSACSGALTPGTPAFARGQLFCQDTSLGVPVVAAVADSLGVPVIVTGLTSNVVAAACKAWAPSAVPVPGPAGASPAVTPTVLAPIAASAVT